MKFIALTYDYDLGKLSEIGRKWSYNVYKNKEFIFDYSSASYATFIDKNPNAILHLYTDDVQLIKEKLSKYNIDQDRIIYIDFNDNLKQFKNNLRYSFEVLNHFINFAKSDTEYTIKIDNDLIFKEELKIDDIENILVWKYERIVSEGDPRWGEIKICKNLLNNLDFRIYNMGVFGYPPSYKNDEAKDIMYKMMDINIEDVTDVDSKIYHCVEQTANNWIFHKYNYKVNQTYLQVEHHFDNKSKCIQDAKYLLK